MKSMFDDKLKMFSLLVTIVLFILLAGFIISCSGEDEEKGKIGVVVTIFPQAEFVSKVGGDNVDITVMIPPGADPHTYEPSPSKMVSVSNADMYAKVGSGIEFETVWMDKIIQQNEEMLILDCSEGIELIEMTGGHEHEDEGDNENHEEGDDHHVEGMDPHIWMSPLNAMQMVENICDGLISIDPDNKDLYEENRDDYLQGLNELNQEIRCALSNETNRVFMVYHPDVGYFCREYDLEMLAIEVEGKGPTAASLAHSIDQAQEYGVRVIFASKHINSQPAEVVASEIDGSVVLIDSLAEDYITNIRHILDKLVKALE